MVELVQAAVSPVAQRPQQQQQQAQKQQQQQDEQQEAQQQQPDEDQPKQAEQAAPAQHVAETPAPAPEPIIGEHRSGWAPPPAPQPHELPAPPGDMRAEGSGHEILLQVC